MKKLLLLLLCTGTLFAQQFKVEDVKGTVKVLKGTSEIWEDVKRGDELSKDAFISVEDASLIILSSDGSRFKLANNAALGLDNIKEISLNDLLLALAQEEIYNVKDNQKESSVKSTAVYGENTDVARKKMPDSIIGERRLNGAIQLAENGYERQAVLYAKETMQKYPATQRMFDQRIIIINIITGLGLYEEALADLNGMKELNLTSEQLVMLNKKIDQISKLIAE